eukprot:g4645.t1
MNVSDAVYQRPERECIVAREFRSASLLLGVLPNLLSGRSVLALFGGPAALGFNKGVRKESDPFHKHE